MNEREKQIIEDILISVGLEPLPTTDRVKPDKCDITPNKALVARGG
ncbi:MAG: hypothetical protein ACYCVD_02510 [Desulfitobacteriaceae bacterium]